MNRQVARITVWLLFAAASSLVHAQECVTVAVGTEIPLPDGTSLVSLKGNLDGIESSIFQQPVSGDIWTVTQGAVDAVSQRSGSVVTIDYQDSDGESIDFPVAICGTAADALRTNLTRNVCRRIAQTWWADHLREEGETEASTDFTAIVFHPEGDVCFTSPGYATVGDRIVVGVVAEETAIIGGEIGFDPCSLESAAPSIYIGDTTGLETFFPQSAAPRIVHELAERRCFNSTVQVSWTDDGEALGQTSISQYDRFRATFQLGVQFSDLHKNSYGLRSDGTDMVVFDKGPIDSGPEYAASLVVYGLPRYFQRGVFTGERQYRGRDILHDNGFADRLSFVFSVGLKDFGDRFSAGFAFELFSGINLTWSYEYAKVNQLVGIAVGDPFSGSASDIPLQEKWERDSVVGLSFDLRYITALAKRQ